MFVLVYILPSFLVYSCHTLLQLERNDLISFFSSSVRRSYLKIKVYIFCKCSIIIMSRIEWSCEVIFLSHSLHKMLTFWNKHFTSHVQNTTFELIFSSNWQCYFKIGFSWFVLIIGPFSLCSLFLKWAHIQHVFPIRLFEM